MSKEKDHINKLNDIVEGATTGFSDGIESTQRSILRSINAKLRNLEVKNGSIVINRANLKVLRNLKEEIRSLVVTPAYRKKLDKYLLNFNKVKRSSDSYFFSLLSGYNADKQVFKTIVASSLDSTKNSLIGAGIDSSIIQPVIDIVNQGITSGMFINDLEDAVRVEIIGDPDGVITGAKRDGRLLRYTGQITRDSLNQFSRNYVKSVSEEYGMNWYYYDGSVIQDTRSYCKERAGKYFHKIEVQKSATKSWSGKIPNTNRSTIFTYCGGYNCRHEYLPVLIDVVPNKVVRRNVSNGNYTPPE